MHRSFLALALLLLLAAPARAQSRSATVSAVARIEHPVMLVADSSAQARAHASGGVEIRTGVRIGGQRDYILGIIARDGARSLRIGEAHTSSAAGAPAGRLHSVGMILPRSLRDARVGITYVLASPN